MKLIVLDHDFPEGCTMEYQLLNNVALGHASGGGSNKYLTSDGCLAPECHEDAGGEDCYRPIMRAWEKVFGGGLTIHHRNGSYYGWWDGRHTGTDLYAEKVKFINVRRIDETDRTGP